MNSSHFDPPFLPNELIHEVLIFVVADSIHSVCMKPNHTSWDLHAVSIISCVSRTFRDIIADILEKAFKTTHPREAVETIKLGLERITYLRDLGLQARQTSNIGAPVPPVPSNDAAHLIHSYSLYMITVALRRSAARTSDELFRSTHSAILKALRMISQVGTHVCPPGIADVLICEVDREMRAVMSLLDVSQGQEILEALMAGKLKYDECKDRIENPEVFDGIIRKMSKAISVIENAVSEYYTSSGSVLQVDMISVQALKSIRLLDTLRKYAEADFGAHTHGIRTRVNSTIKELDILL